MAKEAKQTLELIILIIFTWPVKIFSYIIIVSFATFGFHPAGVKQGSLPNLFNNSRVHQGLKSNQCKYKRVHSAAPINYNE